jgi:hypothetical protein
MSPLTLRLAASVSFFGSLSMMPRRGLVVLVPAAPGSIHSITSDGFLMRMSIRTFGRR